MGIDRDEVLYIARLARLELSQGEVEGLTSDLNAILDYAGKLSELDEVLAAEDVQPTSHAVPITGALRDDEARPGLGAALATREAPAREAGAFVVPRIIEE